MTPEDRAAASGATFPVNGIQYTYAGIVFAVAGCVVSGPNVGLSLTAWTGKGANRVYLPTGTYDTVLNGLPCNFVFNTPPLMAPDGGSQIILDPRGNPITVATYTRNDILAAQIMVYDAVTAHARTLGWTP